MELIPFVLTLELATVASVTKLYSYCKSIVTWISKDRPRLSHTRCSSLLLAAIDLKSLAGLEVQHSPAHAERRLPRCEWTGVNRGNYLADRTAEGDRQTVETFYPEVLWTESSALLVAEELVQQSPWNLTDKKGSPCTTPL